MVQQPPLSERGEEPQWCSSKGGVCFENNQKVLIANSAMVIIVPKPAALLMTFGTFRKLRVRKFTFETEAKKCHRR